MVGAAECLTADAGTREASHRSFIPRGWAGLEAPYGFIVTVTLNLILHRGIASIIPAVWASFTWYCVHWNGRWYGGSFGCTFYAHLRTDLFEGQFAS